MLPRLFRFCPTLLLIAFGIAAHADEPLFGFVYTTDLLPARQVEIEQWATWRRQKAHGRYDLWEGRSELSYGVTDDFQLSAYLIYDKTHAYRNAVDGTTAAPEQFSVYTPAPDAAFNASKFIGVAMEGIWRVMSPYTDPFGLAVYFEPTIGNDFREFEIKAIAQKNFLDDRLVLAANLTWAPELRYLPATPDQPANTNIETDVNLGVGASYRFAPNWSLAWEMQNEREMNAWAAFGYGHWMGNAVYTGPTLHFGGDHFFATATAWEQMRWSTNYLRQKVIAGGRDYDVDFEKFRFRLKLGYYF